MPLDLETMAMLRYAFWMTPEASMSVTQRLRQLISDPDAPIFAAFRQTPLGPPTTRLFNGTNSARRT